MAVEPRVPFPYGRSFFYLRAFLLLVLFAAVLLFLGLQTTTPSTWLGIIAAALFVYLLVIGLSPVLTRHELLRSRIILRQGWYFRCVLPFEEVLEIDAWDGEPKYGLRISVARRTLFVVGSAAGLVYVRPRVPRRFPAVLFMTAREIVFDVEDRDRFLKAVAERRASYEALPARKIPVLPERR